MIQLFCYRNSSLSWVQQLATIVFLGHVLRGIISLLCMISHPFITFEVEALRDQVRHCTCDLELVSNNCFEATPGSAIPQSVPYEVSLFVKYAEQLEA